MEIKTILDKPFTDKQKFDFIVENNHNKGYKIKETTNAIEAWGYTEEEKQEQNKEYFKELYMTRSDFFDGTIKAFGADEKVLKNVITQLLDSLEISETEKMISLNNFENGLNFYRKHPIFDLLKNIPISLGENKTIIITPNQWDKFFDTKDWHFLISQEKS